MFVNLFGPCKYAALSLVVFPSLKFSMWFYVWVKRRNKSELFAGPHGGYRISKGIKEHSTLYNPILTNPFIYQARQSLAWSQ